MNQDRGLEGQIRALVAGHRASEPSYGWVDAMGGLNCCRWGHSMIRGPGPEAAMVNCRHVHQKLGRWRILGCMFWDKQRIDTIKAQAS